MNKTWTVPLRNNSWKRQVWGCVIITPCIPYHNKGPGPELPVCRGMSSAQQAGGLEERAKRASQGRWLVNWPEWLRTLPVPWVRP